MRNSDLFDEFLSGNLTPDEIHAFEMRLSQDEEFKIEFEKHRNFIIVLQESARTQIFKNKLNTIHHDFFGDVNLKKLHFKSNNSLKIISIAAAVSVIAVVATISLLSAGGYLLRKQDTNYTELKREVNQIKNSQDALLIGISNNKKKTHYVAPANYTGTGFAINTKGYFITSLHLVKGSDSIFVENSEVERLATRIVFTDSKLDIAILKVDSICDYKIKEMPYSFKLSKSDLGEKIFTLGYPSQDIVYGEGSISSSSRSGDTNMYQISIPVNPGNSGGPLLDENGMIIGVVSGKNQNAEGTGFASKSIYITELINSIEDENLRKDLIFTKKNQLKGLKRSDQIKRISPFVFNVFVYKGN